MRVRAEGGFPAGERSAREKSAIFFGLLYSIGVFSRMNAEKGSQGLWLGL